MNTDTTKVRFSDRARWGKNDIFKVVEEEMLEQFVKYSFDWQNITTTNKHSDRFKDLLRQLGVNWKGDLQFTKGDKTIFIKSKSQNQTVSIKFDDSNKKAILSIDGNESYKFIVKKEEDRLKVYPDVEVSLGSVMAVYRNLRENYEYRLRYDEAGKFFIKEMELKRNYREAPTVSTAKLKLFALFKWLKRDHRPVPHIKYVLRKNGRFRRHFSLTGLYYHFSTYGESILKPTIIGVIIVGLSTLFWLMQSNPTLQPTFSTKAHFPYSNFTGLSNATNPIQLQKAFERSLADLLPILSLGSDIKVGIVDFIVKIVGGALTFVLLGVALRRKFERKYTR